MPRLDTVPLAHLDDVAWLIALWLAIHGGDPGPDPVQIDETTVLAAATLVSSLSTGYAAAPEPASFDVLGERLQRHFGVEVVRKPTPVGPGSPGVPEPVTTICFNVPGVGRICVTRPVGWHPAWPFKPPTEPGGPPPAGSGRG